MAKLRNLHGMKFTKLTIISRADNNIYGQTRWNCLCDCGNKTIALAYNLNSGVTRSCGCLQREAIYRLGKARLDDLTGKSFGRLTVVSLDKERVSKPHWVCKCSCGNTSIVKASNLKNGSTNSCGCLSAEIHRKKLTKHGLSRTREYLREKAKRRHLRNKTVPLEIAKTRIRDLIRKSIQVRGFRKSTPTHKILGCDYEQLRQHIENQFVGGMSWERFNEIHIDHKIPMASAKTIDEVYKLNHYTNLQPLWAIDNMRKGASINSDMLK